MIRSTAHPLVAFVYRAFGELFGGLVLAGYGETAPPRKRSFLFTERRGGVQVDWVIEAVSDHPPRGEEPLVFAALLKLLVSRTPVPEPFEFRMGDLMAELGWPDTPMGHRIADCVIEKYVAVTFRKYERRRRQRYRKEGAARWGRYKLVSGYLVESGRRRGEARSMRTSNRLDFDSNFVGGLNDGRITFADLEFGALNPLTAPNPDDQPQ